MAGGLIATDKKCVGGGTLKIGHFGNELHSVHVRVVAVVKKLAWKIAAGAAGGNRRSRAYQRRGTDQEAIRSALLRGVLLAKRLDEFPNNKAK